MVEEPAYPMKDHSYTYSYRGNTMTTHVTATDQNEVVWTRGISATRTIQRFPSGRVGCVTGPVEMGAWCKVEVQDAPAT